jgi:ABC-type antimicrobial peptide transport system permease subunit
MGMVLRETALVTAIGICAGVLAALALTALLRNMFFGLSGFEVLPVLAAAAVIAIAAVLAALVPAWRAAHVDPTVALRIE